MDSHSSSLLQIWQSTKKRTQVGLFSHLFQQKIAWAYTSALINLFRLPLGSGSFYGYHLNHLYLDASSIVWTYGLDHQSLGCKVQHQVSHLHRCNLCILLCKGCRCFSRKQLNKVFPPSSKQWCTEWFYLRHLWSLWWHRNPLHNHVHALLNGISSSICGLRRQCQRNGSQSSKCVRYYPCSFFLRKRLSLGCSQAAPWIFRS